MMRYLKQGIDLTLAVCMCLLALVAVPRILGFQVYAVISQSMAPALPVGSAVYVKQEAFEEIRAGDILTYRMGKNRTNVTHRVVETNALKQTVVTKGDANRQPDARSVGYADIAGVVKFSLPYMGYLAAVADEPCGKLVLAGLFLWLLLLRRVADGRASIRMAGEGVYCEY